MAFDNGRKARELFRQIDEHDRRDDTIWRSFLAMEAAGLDIALRQREIHTYLANWIEEATSCGLDPDLTFDQERAIAVEIRQLLRKELGLPCLSSDEIAAWDYQELTFTRARTTGDVIEKPFEDEAFVTRLSEDLIRTQPQLAKSIKTFLKHNRGAGSDRDGFPTFWIVHAVQQFALEADPDLPDILMSSLSRKVMRAVDEMEKD